MDADAEVRLQARALAREKKHPTHLQPSMLFVVEAASLRIIKRRSALRELRNKVATPIQSPCMIPRRSNTWPYRLIQAGPKRQRPKRDRKVGDS
eukprot:5654871-Pleurochrysis_carterae.AAC.1